MDDPDSETNPNQDMPGINNKYSRALDECKEKCTVNNGNSKDEHEKLIDPVVCKINGSPRNSVKLDSQTTDLSHCMNTCTDTVSGKSNSMFDVLSSTSCYSSDNISPKNCCSARNLHLVKNEKQNSETLHSEIQSSEYGSLSLKYAINTLPNSPNHSSNAETEHHNRPLNSTQHNLKKQTHTRTDGHMDDKEAGRNSSSPSEEVMAPDNSVREVTSPRGACVRGEHPGWALWRGPLRGAHLVVAPMVDASELPWRLLSRRYGAELCYTPMLHSVVLVRDARYRRDNLQSCEQDRPLIVQICGNDPATVGEACRLVSPHCDAVDINLGCPQAIARKGRYGAFLMDHWDLVHNIVESAVRCSSVPVTCKMRVFDDRDKTLQFARLLQDAGASLLTVHGRTREQKGPLTGLADWSIIAAIREAVDVPVFANGNIQYKADVERCLAATGAQGVMSAEGNLHNPAIFADPSLFPGSAPTVWQMALEYLQLAEEHPCPLSYSRGHLFKLLHHCFSMAENSDIRQTVSRCSSVADMQNAVQLLKERMTPYVTGQTSWVPENNYLEQLPLRPWLCQPYVRTSPAEHARRCREGQLKAQQRQEIMSGIEGKRALECDDFEEKEADLLLRSGAFGTLSKKKAKKLLRNPRKKFLGSNSETVNLCICRSPRGGKCEYELCKACCKGKCYTDNLDCTGHRIWVKTNRRKASSLPPTISKPHPTTADKNVICVPALNNSDNYR